MAWVYNLFAGECDTDAVLANYQGAGRRDRFYSHLYVGLYFEAEGDAARACQHVTQAAEL
jgi:hypothetical protein